MRAAALLVTLAGLAMPAPAAAALRFEPCKSWECATLRVPLDHSAGRPGRVSGTLRVERNGRGPLGGEFQLSGPSAAAGGVMLRGGRLRGELGGRAVSATIHVPRPPRG